MTGHPNFVSELLNNGQPVSDVRPSTADSEQRRTEAHEKGRRREGGAQTDVPEDADDADADMDADVPPVHVSTASERKVCV